jgi:hypothetical protein
MHLTMATSFAVVSSVAVGWMMAQAGAAKGALSLRTPRRCASCGRNRGARACRCTNVK